MVDSPYNEGVVHMCHPVTRSEMEQLVEYLPGLRRVDIMLRYPAPEKHLHWKAAINLADIFTQVLDMTVYIEEGLENLNEKLERMNMNRTHRFQVKFVSFPSSIKFIISSGLSFVLTICFTDFPAFSPASSVREEITGLLRSFRKGSIPKRLLLLHPLPH
jgi:hypothetical protein